MSLTEVTTTIAPSQQLVSLASEKGISTVSDHLARYAPDLAEKQTAPIVSMRMADTGTETGSKAFSCAHSASQPAPPDLKSEAFCSAPEVLELPFGTLVRPRPLNRQQSVNRINYFSEPQVAVNSDFEFATASLPGNAIKAGLEAGFWNGSEDRHSFSILQDADDTDVISCTLWDGHGGAQTAEYAAENWDRILQESLINRTRGQTVEDVFQDA